MRRFEAKLLGLVGFLAVTMQAWISVPAVLRDPRWGEGATGWEDFPDGLGCGPWFLLQLLVGRLVLALLPPGRPGGLDELPATLATSLFLGGVALDAEVRCLALLGLEVGVLPFLAPWLLVAVLRLATLPGAMVPRHGLRHERGSGLAHGLTFAACAWSAVVLSASDFASRALWEWLGFLVLSAYGLRAARRAPLGRALLLSGATLTALPFLCDGATVQAAARLGLGAVFLVPWMRQADRRAGLLAILAFASLGPLEPRLALASLLSLLLAARPRQRRFALVASLAAAALLVAPGPLSGNMEPDPWSLGEVLQSGFALEDWGVAWIFFALASLAGLGILAARLIAVLQPDARRGPELIEEPLREVLVLALLVPLGFLALRFGATQVGRSWNTLIVLFPVAVLLAGLVLIPGERSGRAPGKPTAKAQGKEEGWGGGAGREVAGG